MGTYTVTSLSDKGDDLTVTGDLAAESADGYGLSLREAIALANANPGEDTVTFDQSLGDEEIFLNGGEISITDKVIIDGLLDSNTSPDITIDAEGNSPIFNFNSNADGSKLQGLSLTGGRSPGRTNLAARSKARVPS